MATLRSDIFLIRGDTSSIAFEFTEGGVAKDLTGSTVFFTAKPALVEDVADATAVILVEVTSHSDPTHGKTVIPLSNTDTDVTPGDYFYDIQVKNGSTVTSIPARKLTVVQDVTKRLS